MKPIFGETITTMEEFEQLRPVIGYPGKLVANKVVDALDVHSMDFIKKSPFLILSTSDEAGMCDASPRGDAPGFVDIIDDKHLFIPERPGNKRMDSIRNILINPQVGILFIIPGMEETFRVNGKACISQDQKLLERNAVNGKLPLLGIGVEIEECFMHCAKAFKRSGLWQSDQWLDKDELPSAARIIAAQVGRKLEVTEEQVGQALTESYTLRLY